MPNYLNPTAGKSREGNGLIRLAGAPATGTSEVQTITISGSPTGGSVVFAWEGRQLGASLTYADLTNATAATAEAAVKAYLEALPGFNGTVTAVRSGSTPNFVFTITYGGNYDKANVSQPTLFSNGLTGGSSPTIAFATTTPGVAADKYPTGTQVVNTSNGKVYVNTGTLNVPTWTVVGSQS